MKILAIETSCDETAAAIVKKEINTITLLSNVISTSLGLHAKTGGIIPEQAAREQIKFIIAVIEKALSDSKLKHHELDAIAVTVGPGLIGSLLVGVETAKTLSYAWNKPIIPVNHLIGHIYANWISNPSYSSLPSFPSLALVVSGGHTDLVLIKNHHYISWLGGTRDDAAGEAFDKIGRMLGFPYPAGPTIAKHAEKGDPKAFDFPRPLIGSPDFDFSFSGLKTAVYREIQTIKQPASPQGGFNKITISDLCASVEHAIIDVLVKKTLKAAQKFQVKSILLGGGVAANEKLRSKLIQDTKYQLPNTAIFFPEKSLCTDNAAMIGAAAALIGKEEPWKNITVDPELYFY